MESESLNSKLRALLKEVQLDEQAIEKVNQCASSIIDAIKSIPSQQVSSIDALKFVRDVGAEDDKVVFTFKSPDFVSVGGSYAIGAVAKPDVSVDLLVRMPKECFYEKDYLNHRYHAKRCLYLRVIEKCMSSTPLIKKIEWSTFQNEARKPILKVYPDTENPELAGLFFNIIPCATSLFNVTKLSLARNNIRSLKQDKTTTSTPKYNNSILEDMHLEENAEFVRKAFHEWKNLQEALILLKVWARNRSSIFAHDCLNGYILSIILAYLVSVPGGHHIPKSMSSMHIFRFTLKFMSTTFGKKGIFLKSAEHCISKEDVTHHLQSLGVLLCDATGNFNLAFRVKKTAFSEFQEEATLALSCANKCEDCGFEELFLTKVDFAAKFDSCLRLNMRTLLKCNTVEYCLDDELWSRCENNVYSRLQQGLNDRARLIRVAWRSAPPKWNIIDGFGKFGHEPMLVGILLSSYEKGFRKFDIGPSFDDKEEAKKYREFWGEKAELRRFEDGKIAESTVWECEPWERHLIVKRITEYVIIKHLGLSKEDIVHVVDQLDFCLRLSGKDPSISSGFLFKAFESLSKKLKDLKEIPLKISNVQPLDPAFRHTSVFPPAPHLLALENSKTRLSAKVPTCIQSIEVMIQLGGSGNWPMDYEAVEKTKLAFLLKIGESLQNQYGLLCFASEDAVDICTKGYAFRLKILHERSLNLVRTQGKNDSVKNTAFVDKDLFLRSQHASMINGLQGRYPLFGPVVRLAKRWVSSHLFSSFLTEEAVELVVACVFLNPYPFQVPCSRVTGFLRFLRLLSDYDWAYSSLTVDINEDFTASDKKEISDNFIKSRKSYKENSEDVMPAMFLATTYDKASEAWTKLTPNRSVLKKIASYAQSSAHLLTSMILQGPSGLFTWECIFRTPLDIYDAVILLHRDKLSFPKRLLFPAEVHHGKHVIRGKASKDFHPYTDLRDRSAFRNLEDARNKLLVDFDPTNLFLHDLKEEYPDRFKAWYDSYGGDAIGLTWKRKVSKKRSRDEADEPSEDEVLKMLKDVGEIGKGFVKSVYLLKSSRTSD